VGIMIGVVRSRREIRLMAKLRILKIRLIRVH